MKPKTEIAHITTPVAKYTLDFKTGVIKAKPIITHGDAIRAMSDEELGEFLAERATAPSCTGKCHKDYEVYGELRTFCHDCWLDWLKREGES